MNARGGPDGAREANPGPIAAGAGGPGAGDPQAEASWAGDPEAAAKNFCLRWLTVRARSRAELATKLRERGIPDAAAERALDRLTDVGLVDDAAFAASFVTSRHRDRGLGRAALRRELQHKGIDSELTEQALQAIDGEAERSRAAALVAKKLDAAMFAGTESARRRLLGMLARRGYAPSVAISVVNDALRGFAEPWDEADGSEPGPDSETAFDA